MANKVPWKDVPILYCISHGREVLGEQNSRGAFQHYDGIGELPCRGPFTFVSPPPPMTEEQWKEVLVAFEKENG